jgi:hypothetical protein
MKKNFHSSTLDIQLLFIDKNGTLSFANHSKLRLESKAQTVRTAPTCGCDVLRQWPALIAVQVPSSTRIGPVVRELDSSPGDPVSNLSPGT